MPQPCGTDLCVNPVVVAGSSERVPELMRPQVVSAAGICAPFLIAMPQAIEVIPLHGLFSTEDIALSAFAQIRF